MSRLRKFLRHTLTIARRDLKAAVFTPSFAFFLLGPALVLGFAVLGSMSAKQSEDARGSRDRMVLMMTQKDVDAVAAQHRQMRAVFADSTGWPGLYAVPDGGDMRTRARRLLRHRQVTAVLYGSTSTPHAVVEQGSEATGRYLFRIARDSALRKAKRDPEPDMEIVPTRGDSASGREIASYFGVTAVFLLTFMLSSQVVGGLAEERSNKIIDVLVAAVPVEAVFFGKLLGELGVSLIFLAFWGTLATVGLYSLPTTVTQEATFPAVATGMAFAPLFACYFVTSYLLASSAILGLSSLASTPRGTRVLALPITMLQFSMLGLATAAMSGPTYVQIIAAVFPYSSPLYMVSRATTDGEIWPHLVAIAWQFAWVAAIIWVSSRMFRYGVVDGGGIGNALRRVMQRHRRTRA